MRTADPTPVGYTDLAAGVPPIMFGAAATRQRVHSQGGTMFNMSFSRTIGCGAVVLLLAGCEPPAAPPAAGGAAPAGLQMAPPPPPQTAGSAAAPIASEVPNGAPPPGNFGDPASPPAGNFGDPAPTAEVSPPIVPDAAPPSAASTPAAAATGRASLDAYIAVEDEMFALLGTVNDAESARAAAPKLQELATRIRPLVRPYWLALAGLSNDEKNEFVLQRALKLRAAEAGPGGNIGKVIDLMKQPGGEELKAAFVAFVRAASEDAPRLHKAAAEKQIAELE